MEEEGPLSSPRSVGSEPNFEIAPLPVICTRKDGSSPEMIPAVRANHPSMGSAIFPLNRIELGDIWYGKAKLGTWEIKVLPGGWDRAFPRFSSLIRYPVEFLAPALEALHQQAFLDKTPLSWTQWSMLCKNTSPKLHAVADCRICGTPRCLSMRLLNEVNRTLDTFQCRSVGARCGEESISKRIFDTYQEIPLPSDSSPPSLPSVPPPDPPFHTAQEGADKMSHRTPFPRNKSKTLRATHEPELGLLARQTDPSDAYRRTIPPPTKYLSSDEGDYCTWSDLKRRRAKHRRRKADTDSESSDTGDERDTLNDTLATPYPKNFLHGTLAKRLRKPDPTLP